MTSRKTKVAVALGTALDRNPEIRAALIKRVTAAVERRGL